MKVNNANYEITAVNSKQYPEGGLPEIAFAGRSNVGKSSIINTLLNRKNLARVGATPGKTRVINFYNIDKKIRFVDLPGYGYAKVSQDQKKQWGTMVEEYFNVREDLRLIILLIDIRHEPSEQDVMMYNWLVELEADFIVVCTKSDKLKKSQIKPRIMELKKFFLDDELTIIPFSSLNRSGSEEIWREIDNKVL